MAEYEMTLVDRQRIARDTMAFWFDTNGASFGFRAGQRRGSKPDRSRTHLVNIADVQTVQTFDAPELGKTFVYFTPTQKHTEHKEAHQKMALQTEPATQASENRTSIAVQTTGR